MKVSVAESGSVIIHSFYCAMQEAEINLFNYTSMLSDTTDIVRSTFSDVVSQEGVVDFGALSVLAHLKLREGDPPVRPS